jgi:hypothetical protein
MTKIHQLQQWEGEVISVSGEFVAATLQDMTDASKPDEFADILLSAFAPEDQELLAPGVVFDWVIGYNDAQERVSSLTVRRRLPPTQAELVRATCDAEAFAALLGIEGPLPKGGF